MPRTAQTRRDFIVAAGVGAASFMLPEASFTVAEVPPERPNVILCMADDLGWGDPAYNGNKNIKTPHLDVLSREGLRLDRFYAGAPVCSPTRGSCLTGRHPYRYGIFNANKGHLPREEVTLAEALKTQGYLTGHFGKWHLGTLTKTIKDSNRGGPRGVKHYAPPWDHGFDVCFSTEAKVPTWNPMKQPDSDEPYGTHYWVGPEQRATENLEGDDSRIIMDRALPFIERAAREHKPFLAVVWFHAPHLPVVAGPRHRALYADQPEAAQHYFGCISALDEQIGRLRAKLVELGLARNTMLCFCSDNGPEGREFDGTNGSAGPLRGRKRSLFEGGVRVPGLLAWPQRIKQPRAINMPCCTSDYFPTILDALGFRMKGQPEPVDGISLLPMIDGKMSARPTPIAFESGKQLALIDNRHKLISQNNGKTFALYDLIDDPGETRDLAEQEPGLVSKYRRMLAIWQESCRSSRAGEDYGA